MFCPTATRSVYLDTHRRPEFAGYSVPPSIPGVNVANVVLVPTILPNFYRAPGPHHRQHLGQPDRCPRRIDFFKNHDHHRDKVPVLGDLPLVGRLFQSQTKISVKKEPDDFCDGHHC